MAANYASHVANSKKAVKKADKVQPVHGRDGDVPQTVVTEGKVRNSAGGASFEATALTKLERFIILGAEGGTFYSGERALTIAAAKNVAEMIEKNGVEVVRIVSEISDAGRAIKNNPAIFVLALCAASKDQAVVKAAFDALPKVCRTGTHLFTFAEYVDSLRGWGKSLKNGIANWYNSQELDKLAYGAIKYQQRNGWSHRDLFRLSHTKAEDTSRNALYRWIVRREKTDGVDLPGIVAAYEKVQADKTVKSAIQGITEFNLSFEMLPTELLKEQKIWEALLPKMGLTAMLRNLGKMSSIGLLGDLSDSAKLVVSRLSDAAALKKARVHPVSIMCALRIYAQGRGDKGTLTWSTNARIVDALNDAFYKTFEYVEPTGKNFLLAVDCSGSMFGSQVVGAAGMDAATGAALMAMTVARTEKNFVIVGYGHRNVGKLPISPNMTLETIMNTMRNFNWGGTDCALPFMYADENKLQIDVFGNFTDNEVWAGPTSVDTALNRYRNKYVENAKMFVAGMCVNDFTIANPADPLQMDVVGFDTSMPAAVGAFAKL